MNKIYLPKYNLNLTLLGGQSFNWDYRDGYYYGLLQNIAYKLKYKDDYLYWQSYPEADNFEYLKNYLNLDENYEDILNTISVDPHVKKAIEKYPDIRLLKQDFDEAFLEFIISSNNSIKAIRTRIRQLREKLGRPIEIDGEKMYLFPTVDAVANSDLELLKSCSLGYRSSYLLESSRKLLDKKLDPSKLTEEELRNELLQMHGIGEKVADCILVYGAGFENLYPIDRWALRILTELYGLDERMKYKQMREWIKTSYNGYAALAGQFLFEYIRHNYPEIRKSRAKNQ